MEDALREDLFSVKAFAPGTCANVAVGYDILGFALQGVGDEVTMTRRTDRAVVVEVEQKATCIPIDPEKNCASLPVIRLLSDYGFETGFTISIRKGVPVSSGMGGSAASSVAALTACNAFLKMPVSMETLIQYACLGEEIASGARHADNIIPSFYGGFCLMQSYRPLRVIMLPGEALFAALVHPHRQISTRQAREILSPTVRLNAHVKQSASLAGFLCGVFYRDGEMIHAALQDHIIEPQRAHLLPGFEKVQHAALSAGALGCSFSGSGPTLFALSSSLDAAQSIADAMVVAFSALGVETEYWLTPLTAPGAHVLEEKRCDI